MRYIPESTCNARPRRTRGGRWDRSIFQNLAPPPSTRNTRAHILFIFFGTHRIIGGGGQLFSKDVGAAAKRYRNTIPDTRRLTRPPQSTPQRRGETSPGRVRPGTRVRFRVSAGPPSKRIRFYYVYTGRLSSVRARPIAVKTATGPYTRVYVVDGGVPQVQFEGCAGTRGRTPFTFYLARVTRSVVRGAVKDQPRRRRRLTHAVKRSCTPTR